MLGRPACCVHIIFGVKSNSGSTVLRSKMCELFEKHPVMKWHEYPVIWVAGASKDSFKIRTHLANCFGRAG